MGIGYILGCLASLLAWKLDRQNLFYLFNKAITKFIKSRILLQFFYALIILAVCFILNQLMIKEVNNFITAFLVIDISNTERKNLKQRERVHFYDSISLISRAVVCGFIAPLLFVVFLGNIYGIAYMLIYNVSIVACEVDVFKTIFIVSTIVPAIIAEVFLYFIYFCRNKRTYIDFKGDYFINLILRPLLNVDILGAYVESVNFYYLYSSRNTDYLKSYGEYTKKIDEVCVKDYLSIGYGICLIMFIIFFIAIK
jgi:hypothetical protein